MFTYKSCACLFILLLMLIIQPASAFDLTKGLGGIKEGLGNIIKNDAETEGQKTGKDEITKTTSQASNKDETTETSAPKSKEIIKPFGGIEWEDDFATVVKKINGFDGIDKWTSPGFVDSQGLPEVAASKSQGLTLPRWL